MLFLQAPRPHTLKSVPEPELASCYEPKPNSNDYWFVVRSYFTATISAVEQ